jgi:ribosomal protein S18 acetylase RimI-like enzyme
MPFEIFSLTRDDLLDWVHIHYLAFNPLLPFMYTSPPSEESFSCLARDRLKTLEFPSASIFKAVETETNKIIGVAYWKINPSERTMEEVESEFILPDPQPETRVEVRDDLWAGIWASRREVIGGTSHVLLESLTVLPEYQRRGVGTALLQWGLDQADK